MDPVLLDLLLNRVPKYLTGARQTKYIMSSSRKQQTEYCNPICQALGQQERTTEDKEYAYWQLPNKSESNWMENLLLDKFVKIWRN